MIRLLVTGGRDFTDAGLVERALSAVHRKRVISLLIEGGQVSGKGKDKWGADYLCRQWAECMGIEVLTFEAKWGDVEAPGAVVRIGKTGMPYNALAGPWRNDRMISEGRLDAAVSFAGGRGTADMVARIEAAGIPLWRLG